MKALMMPDTELSSRQFPAIGLGSGKFLVVSLEFRHVHRSDR
jgi:hypothetical protein